MNLGRIFRACTMASALAVATVSAGVANAETTLKFSHIANEDNTWHLGALEFARLVEEKTGGEVKVEVFPNSSLGTERETIEGIPLGLADLTLTADSLAGWAPSIALQSHMYTFRDEAHVHAFMASDIAQKIKDEVLEKADLRVIGYFLRGPRYLTSNRPIATADDLQGFKLRVPNVPMFIADWEAAGAAPTPMAFAEVFSSLQQGVIDGQENPLALITSQKFYEVQKYINRTAHVRQAIFVVIGESKFQSLSESQQTAILEAAAEAQAYEYELFTKAEAELEDFLTEQGVTFVDVDTESFRARVAGVIAQKYPELEADLERIEALK